MRLDYLIYAVHAAFWSAFGITRVVMRARDGEPPPAAAPAGPATEAPHSRALVALHMLAFGVLYFGVGQAVLGAAVPELFPGQRVAGTIVIAMGAALMCWALVFFRSWRFRAKLDASHELATGGPFKLVRHPIYTGLDLLAIGTALWIPSLIELFAVLMMLVGSDLRGRAEEKLLLRVFGDRYRDYAKTTRRFLPGVY